MEQDHLHGSEAHCRDTKATTQKSISNLEKASRYILDIGHKFSICSHVVETVEHGFTWHPNICERKSAIVNSIQTNLPAHIFNHDSFAGLHLVVSDLGQERIDTFVLAIDDGLGKHNHVVCMACTVCDPELL